MRIPEETFHRNGREITLRNACPEDAQMLLDYLKTVTGETRFLMMEPDQGLPPLHSGQGVPYPGAGGSLYQGPQ